MRRSPNAEAAGVMVCMPLPLPRTRPVVRLAAAIGTASDPARTQVASIAVYAEAEAADRVQSATLSKGV